MTLQELKCFRSLYRRDLEAEIKQLEEEIKDINRSIDYSTSKAKDDEAKRKQLEVRVNTIEQYMHTCYSPVHQMEMIKAQLSTFNMDMLSPILVELFTTLEGKEYKYYEILSTDREFDDDHGYGGLHRNFYRVFSAIPYAVYYPEGYFNKRKEEDESLICFAGPIWVGREEFGKNIHFERSKYVYSSMYMYDGNISSFLIQPRLCTDGDFDDDYFANSRITDYSRQFIDKIIDYRIGKMYPNYILTGLPVYNDFLSSSEGDDITEDELKGLLDEFIADYKTKGIQKKKSDDLV